MPRKKATVKNQQFTCSNSSCGLIFSNPIKVMNLGVEDLKPYDACPRCLAAFTSKEELSVTEAKPDIPVEESKDRVSVPKSEEAAAKPEPAFKCSRHFGYLSERPKSEKMPEECMTCENIVNCMLKSIRG